LYHGIFNNIILNKVHFNVFVPLCVFNIITLDKEERKLTVYVLLHKYVYLDKTGKTSLKITLKIADESS